MLRKILLTLAFGLAFLVLALFTNALAWRRLIFRPDDGPVPVVGFTDYLIGLPYEVFFGPAFLIPPGSCLDSTFGLIFIGAILVVFWGAILTTIFTVIRKALYRKR